MAEGGLNAAGVDLAVAVTGIAGPGGGSAQKPVGLVHIACATPAGMMTEVHRFGDIGRDAVRMAAVEVALKLVLRTIEATP